MSIIIISYCISKVKRRTGYYGKSRCDTLTACRKIEITAQTITTKSGTASAMPL